MTLVFYNGPVQNGDFTLATTPGKAVGIRIGCQAQATGTTSAPRASKAEPPSDAGASRRRPAAHRPA